MNPENTRRRQPKSLIGSASELGRRHRPDYILMLCMVMLLAIGLVVIYSVSPAISAQLVGDVDPNHFMYKQIIFLIIGLSAFAFGSLMPLSIWSKLQKPIIFFQFLSKLNASILASTYYCF